LSHSAQSRTVVHIGYQKCASTYLQRVVFPMLGNFANFGNCSSSGISHAEKALLYRRDMEPEQYRSMVDRHIVSADDHKPYKILSSEDYTELPFLGFERNVGSVARLKGVDLTPYDHRNEVICTNLSRVWPDAYILIIIREPLNWAVSKYDHWYRRDLVDEILEGCLDSLGESYDRLVHRYIERFGRDHVRVVPYEWLLRDSGKFLKAVTEFIDPGFDSEMPNARMNAAPPSAGEVEYRRMQYKLKHFKGTGWRKSLMQLARELQPVSKPYYRLRYGPGPQRSVVPEETARRLRPQLAASNLRLEALTGLSLGELGYDVSQEAV